MDPYLRPGAFVPSLSADQCAAALAQTAVNPPPPAQHVQPKALPVASLLMRPARTLAQATVTHTRGTKFASGMELVAEEIKAATMRAFSGTYSRGTQGISREDCWGKASSVN